MAGLKIKRDFSSSVEFKSIEALRRECGARADSRPPPLARRDVIRDPADRA
jgi:hypothetical protein